MDIFGEIKGDHVVALKKSTSTTNEMGCERLPPVHHSALCHDTPGVASKTQSKLFCHHKRF